MSKTTEQANELIENVESISGLDGCVADFVEGMNLTVKATSTMALALSDIFDLVDEFQNEETEGTAAEALCKIKELALSTITIFASPSRLSSVESETMPAGFGQAKSYIYQIERYDMTEGQNYPSFQPTIEVQYYDFLSDLLGQLMSQEDFPDNHEKYCVTGKNYSQDEYALILLTANMKKIWAGNVVEVLDRFSCRKLEQ